MKKILLLFIAIFFVKASYAEDYDPQHTVLALNMAVVSVNRIISTQDRITLDYEYNNIINNLKLANIESDSEITELYQELLNTINKKILSKEDSKRLQENYNKWQKKQLSNAIYGLRMSGNTPVTMSLSFAVSCVSSYFAYQKITQEVRNIINDEIWRIEKQELENYNALQTKLLNSSWRLLRQYKIPDEYRLVQSSVDDFFRAVNENEPSKRLGMFRSLENEFRVYPPYWIYRARTAQELDNNSEAKKCFDEFNKVWRPVLRQDMWKAEAEKFYVQEAINNNNKQEALKHLENFCSNVPRNDWANNLFAGVAYFLLDEKDSAIEKIGLNINFDSEKDISNLIMAQIKSGELDFSTLSYGVKSVTELSSPEFADLLRRAENDDVDAIFTLGEMYRTGYKVAKNYQEAVKWYEKLAYEGYSGAQYKIGDLYFEGDSHLKQDYKKSYVWYYVSGERSWNDTNGAVDYVFSSIGQGLGNVFTLGGFVDNYSNFSKLEGEGLFNLAKLSSSEIEEARAEARKIIAKIVNNIKQNPKNQAHKTNFLINVAKTPQIDENVRLEAKNILEKITREIISNPEKVLDGKQYLEYISDRDFIDSNLRDEVKKVLEQIK